MYDYTGNKSGTDNGNGGESLTALVTRELGTLRKNQDAFMQARKAREAEFEQDLTALSATVTAMAQRQAGGGTLPSGAQAFGATPRGGLGKAASAIIDGLRNSRSFRTELSGLSLKGLQSDLDPSTDHTEYPVTPTSLGPVNTYGAPIATLVGLMPLYQTGAASSISFCRVNYGAAAVGLTAAVAPELTLKPESTTAVTEVILPLDTYAHWIEVSRQLLADQPGLQLVLNGLLRAGLAKVVDDAVYVAMTTSGSYTAHVAESDDEIGDSVARAAATIAAAGGASIQVALNPTDILAMDLRKASTSGVYLGRPANVAQRVVGVPAVPAGKVLAFAAGSGATWAERMGVVVEAGVSGDQFQRNALTLLCEGRGAVMIQNPAHVVWGDVLAA